MMRKKQLASMLEEKSERVLVLETKLESLRQQLDSYHEREQSIVASLAAAQTAAARQMSETDQQIKTLLEEAEAKARRMMADAQFKASASLESADAQARAMIESAKAQADSLLFEAKNQRTALLAQTEADQTASIAEVRRLNALLEQSASAALAAAEQYAALCGKNRVEASVSLPEQSAESAAETTVSETVVQDLPDPANDPARLMQNIYQLQNRDIPAEVQAPEQQEPTPAQDIPEPDPAAVDELMPDFAPRPEDAYPSQDGPDDGEAYIPEPDWQLEEEPEQGAPTVDELLPDDDQVAQSLDALLDEIIRAGE